MNVLRNLALFTLAIAVLSGCGASSSASSEDKANVTKQTSEGVQTPKDGTVAPP